MTRHQEVLSNEKIRFKERFSFGLGSMASNIVFAAVSNFIAFYYRDIIGVSAAAVGTLLVVSRIFDGFSDLGMGILIDNTYSKYGKARPWILWMAIPFGLMTMLVFSVPEIGKTGQLIYAYLTYNLLITVFYTAVNTPCLTMNSLITQDPNERSVLNLFAGFMATVATILIGMVTLPLVNIFGGDRKGWQLTFTIFGVLATVLFFITFFFTKERVKPSARVEVEKISQKAKFLALIKNKYWLLLLLFAIVAYISQGLMGVTIYYAKYILGEPKLIGLLTMAMFAPIGLLMFMIAPVAKRIGKRNTILVGSLILVLSQIIIALAPNNLTVVLIGTVVKGVGMAPIMGLLFALLADTVEYGEYKYGVRTEGLIYSAAGLGAKLGIGFGTGLIGWALASVGYTSNMSEVSPEIIRVIKALFIYVPLVLAVIQLIVMYFYRLDDEFETIVLALKKRTNENKKMTEMELK